jgi:hypothetical protein
MEQGWGDFRFSSNQIRWKKTGRQAMKQFWIRLLSATLLLAGCAPATVETPILPSASRTSTPVPATATPSPTQIPPTQTITSLPTIPTFTPTFEAATIVTAAPAQPASCPKENPAVIAKFATPYSNGSYDFFGADDVLTYLNSGGSLNPFITGPAGSPSDTLLGTIVDLTGDGVSEVVVRGLVRYDILGCKDGKYENLFKLATYDFSIDLEDILDLNKDGIPEIIFYSFSRYGYANIYIIEWDGIKFRSLIHAGTDEWTEVIIDSVPATEYHKSIDANNDGLKEIVAVYNVNELCGGLGNPCDGTPARKQSITLAWNGQNYVVLAEGSDPPQYRFQAIQDGDLQARYGYYAEALSFYQAAIFDDRLEWWSPERELYEIRTYWTQYDPTPTVYPTAIFDDTEYPRLAAYAYYRIMLLHIVQGHESDAGTVYKTLQQKFGSDPYGRPYAEMATAFWETYQSTYKMYTGCAAAIQYAVEHPEILAPLGSDYHGYQSHTYAPEDVCPLR